MVALGIGLGYLARLTLGAPAVDDGPTREINRPLPEVKSLDNESIDLPLLGDESDSQDDAGLVPPIPLPGELPVYGFSQNGFSQYQKFGNDDFGHGAEALFEPHGEKLCASGCAASRHPTETLTAEHFKSLLVAYTYEPMDQTNNALEELMYFGPQTKKMIEAHGVGDLDSKRAEFLWEQLKYNKAKVSIRVVDESGVVRSWIEPTEVPFDRRHIFEMQTKNVQDLVTSGTVKRVGLNHCWLRL